MTELRSSGLCMLSLVVSGLVTFLPFNRQRFPDLPYLHFTRLLGLPYFFVIFLEYFPCDDDANIIMSDVM